jgi:hypothetical protein
MRYDVKRRVGWREDTSKQMAAYDAVHDPQGDTAAMQDDPGWPPILYHYTDAAGLVGILNPSTWPDDIERPAGGAAQLRASDVRYMNDSRELRHGVALLKDRLRAETRAEYESGDVDSIFELIAKRLDVELFAEFTTKQLRVFAACLCASGDLLSQWRGYAGGVGGYAIGFPTDLLKDRSTALQLMPAAAGHFAFRAELQPVIYGEADAAPALDELVAGLRTAWADGWLVATDGGASFDWVSGFVYSRLAQLKDDAFREEREYRLLAFVEPGQPVSVRPRAAGLVPCVEFGINLPEDGVQAPGAVAEIVVGPGADQDGQVAAVRDLLQLGGFPDADVRPSKAPYRG